MVKLELHVVGRNSRSADEKFFLYQEKWKKIFISNLLKLFLTLCVIGTKLLPNVLLQNINIYL
ncbi:unnamed protein product [Larinioides sclopetarius]|uniref:Uncharacterized protein n=1 Tax=Larinioides sclopetarius TaxID=280406 RepID=A0AAV1ZCS5_9ARAC